MCAYRIGSDRLSYVDRIGSDLLSRVDRIGSDLLSRVDRIGSDRTLVEKCVGSFSGSLSYRV